jgi:hypothetical protein
MKRYFITFKIRLSFALIILFTAYQSVAQETADTTKIWKIDGNTSINFSQVSLTNWAEGGDGSFSGTFLFNINANKKKNKHYWDNNFALEYGLVKSESEGLKKSVDRINLSSKYGYELSKKWFLSALYDYKTQMSDGYNYPNDSDYISRFMAPGYMNLALGFDYKPNDNFSLILSPTSTKFTFVLDKYLSDQGSFGVDPGDQFRSEFGAYIKMVYLKKELISNVDFETKLDLFSNYLDNPQNVDVNWDLKLDMKINKYLSAKFGTSMRYDDNIDYIDGDGVKHGPRLQLKQFLGVGLSFKF